MGAELEAAELTGPAAQVLERVRRGEEITIVEGGRPVARIVPVSPAATRGFGSLKGQIRMSEDFNAPLPEDELREWEK